MRHCVLCFLSSLLPGITKGFMSICRNTSMMLQGGDFTCCQCSQIGDCEGTQGIHQKWGIKVEVRKAGSQPPGQSRALSRFLTFQTPLPKAGLAARTGQKAATSWYCGKGKSGEDKISILCLQNAMILWKCLGLLPEMLEMLRRAILQAEANERAD